MKATALKEMAEAVERAAAPPVLPKDQLQLAADLRHEKKRPTPKAKGDYQMKVHKRKGKDRVWHTYAIVDCQTNNQQPTTNNQQPTQPTTTTTTTSTTTTTTSTTTTTTTSTTTTTTTITTTTTHNRQPTTNNQQQQQQQEQQQEQELGHGRRPREHRKADWKVQKKGAHGWEITETGSGVKKKGSREGGG